MGTFFLLVLGSACGCLQQLIEPKATAAMCRIETISPGFGTTAIWNLPFAFSVAVAQIDYFVNGFTWPDYGRW